MPFPSMQQKGYTYGDYLSWPDGERFELIEGVPYSMSPAPSTQHQRVVLALATQVHNHLTDKGCEVFVAPFDIRLPETDEADEDIVTVVQPDISVICDPSKFDEKGCRGAPDWIVEVLSPHTASKDHIRKRELYEKHGVREYWLVHPTDQLVTVFIQGEDGKFGAPSFHDGEGEIDVKTIQGLTLDLDAIFL